MHLLKPSLTLVGCNTTYRDSLALILKSLDKYYITNSYDEGAVALKKLKRDRSELVIVGELADMPVEKFVSEVNSENSLLKILALHPEFTTEGVTQLLSAGATGLMTTASSYDEIVEAIDTILKGGAPMSWSVTGLLIGFFQKNPHCPLTKRERTILLMQTKGKTYSEIGKDLIISPETVRMHIRNTYQKLNVNSKSAAIEKALAEKYILSY